MSRKRFNAAEMELVVGSGKTINLAQSLSPRASATSRQERHIQVASTKTRFLSLARPIRTSGSHFSGWPRRKTPNDWSLPKHLLGSCSEHGLTKTRRDHNVSTSQVHRTGKRREREKILSQTSQRCRLLTRGVSDTAPHPANGPLWPRSSSLTLTKSSGPRNVHPL